MPNEPSDASEKIRVDSLLTELGLFKSRTAAAEAIRSGQVQVRSSTKPHDFVAVEKVAEKFTRSTEFRVQREAREKFVSRAGLKLEAALERLAARDPEFLQMRNRDAAQTLDRDQQHAETQSRPIIALDLGQSTGGFTDCLLQNAVSEVLGIEVGHSQLDPKLLNDPRVTTLEKCNARYLANAEHEASRQVRNWLEKRNRSQGFDLVVGDLSFISLKLILPAVLPWLDSESDGVALFLVKPQFELGPSKLDKNGIVRDESLYEKLREDLTEFITGPQLNRKLIDYFESPIKGGDGNREFLVIFK